MNEIPSLLNLRTIDNPFTTEYRNYLLKMIQRIKEGEKIIISTLPGGESNVPILLGELFLITGKQYEAITFGKHYLIREK